MGFFLSFSLKMALPFIFFFCQKIKTNPHLRTIYSMLKAMISQILIMYLVTLYMYILFEYFVSIIYQEKCLKISTFIL